MEQRLKNLRGQLERRRAAKDLLVELELKRIVNEADGLAWPTGPEGSNFGGGDYEDSYDDDGGRYEGVVGMTSDPLFTMRKPRSLPVDDAKERGKRLQEMIAAQKGWSVLEEKEESSKKDNLQTPGRALREVGLACMNHESANQRFPTNIIGPDGEALLSWRVAVLPFIGNEGILLYKKFHLDEPWYSEHNKTLLKEIPKVFKNVKEDGTKTSILGFEMDGAMFENDKQFNFGHITDGSSNTILIINAAEDLAVEWTKPADISLGDYKSREPKQLFRDGEENVVLCDASAHQVGGNVDAKTLQHLILRNDGQVVDIRNVSK